MALLKEFKEFAMRGNVVDMAVGVIIGAAFGKIVTSLVNDLLMPLIGGLIGNVDFTKLKLIVSQAVKAADGSVVKEAVTLNYGNFIQVVVDFLIVAFCIFMVIKGINKASNLKKKEEEAPAEPEAPAPKPDDIVLLEEIRDLLKEKKSAFSVNRHSLFSGLLIGLGAYGFLALGGIPGAVIFAFGLVTIVLSGTPLYTGKAGCTNDIPALVKIWFFNIIGCALIGLMVAYLKGDAAERAVTVVASRLECGPLKAFVKAIGCGMIIDTVVWLFREKKGILPVIIGVPLFIVCGFYHSIADVVYLVGAWKWDNAILFYYPAIVLGNYVGCNVRRVVLPKDFLKQ